MQYERKFEKISSSRQERIEVKVTFTLPYVEGPSPISVVGDFNGVGAGRDQDGEAQTMDHAACRLSWILTSAIASAISPRMAPGSTTEPPTPARAANMAANCILSDLMRPRHRNPKGTDSNMGACVISTR